MKATQQQLNIIANAISEDGDSSARAGMSQLANRLFVESKTEIYEAVLHHPINVRWNEYCVAPHDKRGEFLLPEE